MKWNKSFPVKLLLACIKTFYHPSDKLLHFVVGYEICRINSRCKSVNI